MRFIDPSSGVYFLWATLYISSYTAVLQAAQIERVRIHDSAKTQHRSPKSNERKSSIDWYGADSRDGATINNIALNSLVTAAALVYILTVGLF